MSEVITKLDVGNYYGNLKLKVDEGKFFWCVENYDGDNWKEISESLYKTLMQHASIKK